MTTLDLSGQGLTDWGGQAGKPAISHLASRTELYELYLNDNKIRDISPLASLTNLEVLTLTGTQITDVAPLASLSKLKKLVLSTNQITDCSVGV
jgi:Leucine-rich repeat (LRR) protein